jgi:hypothetical protein
MLDSGRIPTVRQESRDPRRQPKPSIGGLQEQQTRIRGHRRLVEATTGGGDIDIGPVAGSVLAGTGAGEVQMTLVDAHGQEQRVEIASGSGRVVIELPASFDGEFDLETAYTENHRRATRIESSWDLEQLPATDWDDRHGTPRRYVRARGAAGNGRGFVQVRTVNGDIVVRKSGTRSER